MPTPCVTENQRDDILRLKASGVTHREIALALGVSHGTVSNVYIASKRGPYVTHAPKSPRVIPGIESPPISKTEDPPSLAVRYERALQQIAALQADLNACASFAGLKDLIVPVGMELRSTHSRHEATPWISAADWHADEVIVKASVGGLNEYNVAIASERIHTFFERAVKLTQIYAKDSEIKHVVFASLGDLISGWIHDELVETNSMTPPEAALFVLNEMAGGLELLLKELPDVDITFVGVVGNHARITKKPQSKNRQLKSYEWMIYKLLAQFFAAKGCTRIKWQLPEGYFNWVQLYGRLFRVHHGDNIRYQGGVGGIEIPLRKAISQWNKARTAYMDVMGHWHTTLFGRAYALPSSLIGYSNYSETIKSDFEPPAQMEFLVHNKYGATGFYPIYV